MNSKHIGNSRQRLSTEYRNLVEAINRTRLATKDIAIENTELLYDLYEGDLQRLRSIREALKTIDAGHYGECVRCGEAIKEKRLIAATLCIRCQEETEIEQMSSPLVLAGMNEPETEP